MDANDEHLFALFQNTFKQTPASAKPLHTQSCGAQSCQGCFSDSSRVNIRKEVFCVSIQGSDRSENDNTQSESSVFPKSSVEVDDVLDVSLQEALQSDGSPTSGLRLLRYTPSVAKQSGSELDDGPNATFQEAHQSDVTSSVPRLLRYTPSVANKQPGSDFSLTSSKLMTDTKSHASGDHVLDTSDCETPRASGFLGQLNRPPKKEDRDIWAEAWSRPSVAVNGFECNCKTQCATKVSMATAHELFIKVWSFDGKSDLRFISQTDRKAHLKTYLRSCFTRRSTGDRFVFYGDSIWIRGQDGKFFETRQEICEHFACNMLNMLEPFNKERKNYKFKSLWYSIKKDICLENNAMDLAGNIDQSILESEKLELLQLGKRKRIGDRMQAYFEVYSRGCEQATTGPNSGKVFLPVATITEFYELYKRDCRAQGIPEADWGSSSTFRIAYELVKDKLLLQGSAGDFNKCEFCNTCRYMVSDRQGMTEEARMLVYDCKHAHVLQQELERKKSDVRREEARHIDATTGSPNHAFILVDPCTNYRGNSPIVGKKGDNTDVVGKLSKHFEQRIIGVEVVCGPVDGIFFYTTDNMQRGGANVLVS